MMKFHELTDEELTEFYKIGKLIASEDQESVELGVSLLEIYPQNIRSKRYDDPYSFLCKTYYSRVLSDILYEYKSGKTIEINWDSMTGKKSTDNLQEFISDILLDGKYYYEI